LFAALSSGGRRRAKATSITQRASHHVTSSCWSGRGPRIPCEESRPTGAASPREAAVVFIFVTVVLDRLALGIIVPVLPKLVLGFYSGRAPSPVCAAWPR
jgi:hypothetical protein